MKDAELTDIHVSQNVPQRSPMEVAPSPSSSKRIRRSCLSTRWRSMEPRLARSRSPNLSPLLRLLPGTWLGILVRVLVQLTSTWWLMTMLVLVNMCVQCSCACGCIDKHLEGDVATTLNSLTSVGRSGGTKVAASVTVPRIYPATKYVVFLAPPVNQCRQYLVEVL